MYLQSSSYANCKAVVVTVPLHYVGISVSESTAFPRILNLYQRSLCLQEKVVSSKWYILIIFGACCFFCEK